MSRNTCYYSRNQKFCFLKSWLLKSYLFTHPNPNPSWKNQLQKLHTNCSWEFFSLQPLLPKTAQNFPFYRLFYTIVSAKVSEWAYAWYVCKFPRIYYMLWTTLRPDPFWLHASKIFWKFPTSRSFVITEVSTMSGTPVAFKTWKGHQYMVGRICPTRLE